MTHGLASCRTAATMLARADTHFTALSKEMLWWEDQPGAGGSLRVTSTARRRVTVERDFASTRLSTAAVVVLGTFVGRGTMTARILAPTTRGWGRDARTVPHAQEVLV